MKSLNTERVSNPVCFHVQPEGIIGPLLQVPFQGVLDGMAKWRTSALFLTETLLQFLMAYPALMSSMSPDVWLKMVEKVCGTED